MWRWLLWGTLISICACAAPTAGTLRGPLSAEALRSVDAKWQAAFASAEPDPAASRELASVAPGAEITVVLGTWCGDSRREVSRFVRALELAGNVPLGVSYIGVDRKKEAPGFDAKAMGVRFVPTFIVKRDGSEVGRVVESSPEGIERDVLALLRGHKHGVVTGRTDL